MGHFFLRSDRSIDRVGKESDLFSTDQWWMPGGDRDAGQGTDSELPTVRGGRRLTARVVWLFSKAMLIRPGAHFFYREENEAGFQFRDGVVRKAVDKWQLPCIFLIGLLSSVSCVFSTLLLSLILARLHAFCTS
jgi:hypothetical protein